MFSKGGALACEFREAQRCRMTAWPGPQIIALAMTKGRLEGDLITRNLALRITQSVTTEAPHITWRGSTSRMTFFVRL